MGAFFSSESIDLQTDKDYKINNTTVLSETELGSAVVKSNLRRVGTLQKLKVAGNLTVGEYLFWDNDSMRLGIGIDAPNGDLSIGSMDHEFIIAADEREFKVGSRQYMLLRRIDLRKREDQEVVPSR